MYQPKVNNIEKYSDSQGEHVVCKGKLVLIYLDKGNTHWVQASEEVAILLDGDYYKPIIISETEEIEEGDYVYHPFHKDILHWKEDIPKEDINEVKVLALPEHFSDKHLQAIVDGKMENRDKVLVKCCETATGEYEDRMTYEYYVDLDQQNHITLFPAKQSLEEAAEEYASIISKDLSLIHNLTLPTKA